MATFVCIFEVLYPALCPVLYPVWLQKDITMVHIPFVQTLHTLHPLHNDVPVSETLNCQKIDNVVLL